jgi:hypothetical protein
MKTNIGYETTKTYVSGTPIRRNLMSSIETDHMSKPRKLAQQLQNSIERYKYLNYLIRNSESFLRSISVMNRKNKEGQRFRIKK